MKKTTGRALFLDSNGDIYIGRGCQIFRSTNGGLTWNRDCFVPSFGWKHVCSQFRPFARLLRWYIAAFRVLADGSRIAVARDGIYRATAGCDEMTRVFAIQRGARPLNFSVDGSRILFGEYGSGLEESRVVIYISDDFGQTFHVGFQFPRGDIRHVHHVLVDPYQDGYWVLVGDFGRQTGIGHLSRDLKHLDWIGRGTQRYRAVSAFVDRYSLTYGTDSDRDRNFIVQLNKQSGRINEMVEVEGSSLHCAQFGSVRLISTCVEPNPVCQSPECSIYGCNRSGEWKRLIVHRKDFLSPKYFQFGTLVLPYTEQQTGEENLSQDFFYSGQAIQGLDGQVVFSRHESEASGLLRVA